MAYWRYPVKQKSPRTIERNQAIKSYDKVFSHSRLEKLSNKDLAKQKELFEKEIQLLNSDYSIKNFNSNLEKLNLHIKNIEKTSAQVKSLCKEHQKLIKKNITYYKEDAFFYPACLVIERIRHEGDFDNLLHAEQKLFLELESKEYNKLKYYFQSLISLIECHYLIYELPLFKNNKISWGYNYPTIFDKGFTEHPIILFKETLEEIKNETPKGEGGYFYNPNITYEEFINNNKVPTYGNLEPHAWKQTFDKFYKCSKDDHKHAEIILRFDETNYKKERNKWKTLIDYDNNISNEKYLKTASPIRKDFYLKYFSLAIEALNRVLRKIELLIRSKIKQKQKFDDTGTVYLLSNPAYKKPSLYKIGSTYRLIEERIEELNSETGVAYPFELEYKIKIKNAEYYEKAIHKLFKKYRHRKNKE